MANYYETEFILIHEANCSFKELDDLEYYRMQYFIKNLNEFNKKKKEQEEKNNGDNKGMKLFDKGSLMAESRSMMKSAKTPSIPDIKIPKF